jgi:hypothetical protein
MTMKTYIRWQKDQSRLGRELPPLNNLHPAGHLLCSVCEEQLGNGTPVRLVAIGPEESDRGKHEQGRWYSAVAIIIHSSCSGE